MPQTTATQPGRYILKNRHAIKYGPTDLSRNAIRVLTSGFWREYESSATKCWKPSSQFDHQMNASRSSRLPPLAMAFSWPVRNPSNVVVLSTKKVMMSRFRFKWLSSCRKRGTYCYHPLRNIPGSTCPFAFILNTIPNILYRLNGKLMQLNCQVFKRMGFQLTMKHVPCLEPPHLEKGAWKFRRRSRHRGTTQHLATLYQ